MNLSADFTKSIGSIRALNGSNGGPNLSLQKIYNCNEEFAALKIPYVRLHDIPLTNPGMRIADTSMIFANPLANENDSRNYYFQETDDYIRNLLSCGSRVVYRLGPSIEHTLDNYNVHPPVDIDKWCRICINIIRHYNEGWANGFFWDIQYWEVWNEPNARPHMWTGDDAAYFQLYLRISRAIKEHNPKLKVGGPSLSSPSQKVPRWESAWKFSADFLAWCKKENAPLDFYSWHSYPKQLDYIIDDPFRVREILNAAGYPEAELHLNEWHYCPSWDMTPEWLEGPRGRNGIDAACFIASVLSAWQDTPLTLGNYYMTDTSPNWGIYDPYNTLRGSYYGLLAFAKMLDYPERVFAETEERHHTILAGKNGTGEGAVLVSACNTEQSELVLELSGVNLDSIVVRMFDDEKKWETILPEISGKKLILVKPGVSALWLITGLKVPTGTVQ